MRRTVCVAALLGAVSVAALAFILFDQQTTADEDEHVMTEEASTEVSLAKAIGLFDAGDYAAAIDILRPLAEQDDVRAQCKLGVALTRIAEANQRHHQIEAVKWLDQCIRRYNHPDPEQTELARQLTNDLIRTIGWDIVGEGRYLSFQFQQAKLNAENGQLDDEPEFEKADVIGLDPEDAFSIGILFNEGREVPVDYEIAFFAFQRAAEAGMPEAAFNIGLAYYVGKGVKADPVQALHWFKIAAEGSFAQAATMAGVMMARGHGQAQDIDQGILLLRRAEQLGDEQAGMIAEAVSNGDIPY